MLEDVNLDGTATRDEPVSVTVAAPNAVHMTTFSAAGAAAAAAMPALGGLAAAALSAVALAVVAPSAIAGVTRKRR